MGLQVLFYGVTGTRCLARDEPRLRVEPPVPGVRVRRSGIRATRSPRRVSAKDRFPPRADPQRRPSHRRDALKNMFPAGAARGARGADARFAVDSPLEQAGFEL